MPAPHCIWDWGSIRNDGHRTWSQSPIAYSPIVHFSRCRANNERKKATNVQTHRCHNLDMLVCCVAAARPAAQAAPRCFPEAAPAISACIDGPIADFWARNGGLPVFGYPIGAQQARQVEGRALQAQAFERNRLELHPENAAPYDVLLGRMGAELLAKQGRDWKTFPQADPARRTSSARPATRSRRSSGNTGRATAWSWMASRAARFGEPGAVRSAALRGADRDQPDRRPALPDPVVRARALRAAPRECRHAYEVLLGLLGRELDAAAAAPAARRSHPRQLSFRP